MEELGAEDPWKVVRVAKDLFRLRSSMGDMFDGDKQLWTKEETCAAINSRNFIVEEPGRER